MIRARSVAAGLLALSLTLFPSCAMRTDLPRATPSVPRVGIYKSLLIDASGNSRRFRLMLFAALPDRLHAEILTPLGSTRLILDGGNGKLSVTDVPDGVSYVGDVSPDALERVLGIRVSLDELVGGLLGTWPGGEGITVERVGSRSGLPETFEVRTNRARLRLELRKMRPLLTDATVLGSGRAPDGTEIRALDDLDLAEGMPALPEFRGEGP